MELLPSRVPGTDGCSGETPPRPHPPGPFQEPLDPVARLTGFPTRQGRESRVPSGRLVVGRSPGGLRCRGVIRVRGLHILWVLDLVVNVDRTLKGNLVCDLNKPSLSNYSGYPIPDPWVCVRVQGFLRRWDERSLPPTTMSRRQTFSNPNPSPTPSRVNKTSSLPAPHLQGPFTPITSTRHSGRHDPSPFQSGGAHLVDPEPLLSLRFP